ncbi:MAG: DNA polymerase III subunit delta [Methylophilaceae bacterium]
MLLKFAPSNLIQLLQEKNKNCLIVTGNEPVITNSIKDDISKFCAKTNIDKKIVTCEATSKVDELKTTLQNQSLFNAKILLDITFHNGKINSDLKSFIKSIIPQTPDSFFVLYFKKPTKEFLRSVWFNDLVKFSITLQAEEPNLNQIGLAIKERTVFHKITIEEEAIELLANLSLGNLLAAENEIKKISLVHRDKLIKTTDLIYHISNGSKFDGFQLLEYCIKGQLDKVILAIKYLQEEATEPLLLNGLFAWIFRAISKLKFSPNIIPNNQNLIKLRIFGNSQTLVLNALKGLSASQINASLNKIKEIDLICKGILVGEPWLELNRFSFGIARIMNKKSA